MEVPKLTAANKANIELDKERIADFLLKECLTPATIRQENNLGGLGQVFGAKSQ
ncbi:hypothetical protein [Rhodopirellula bahusiensis]|uniref:hypothetical protein n=1 Tax=Rhodopirellula bahusiensis TaxID=2014065 RepID=UPI0018EC8A68|nr:hypothetical protein [Rhodopirellula bahusiensis]